MAAVFLVANYDDVKFSKYKKGPLPDNFTNKTIEDKSNVDFTFSYSCKIT
jgi:hypothetical protein